VDCVATFEYRFAGSIDSDKSGLIKYIWADSSKLEGWQKLVQAASSDAFA
jgi:hypothetical protein